MKSWSPNMIYDRIIVVNWSVIRWSCFEKSCLTPVSSIKFQCMPIKIWRVPVHFNEFWMSMANLRKYEHMKHENYDLCHRNEKKKSKLCFVESSFRQKVWSVFPIAQCRVAPLLLNEIKILFNPLWFTLH